MNKPRFLAIFDEGKDGSVEFAFRLQTHIPIKWLPEHLHWFNTRPTWIIYRARTTQFAPVITPPPRSSRVRELLAKFWKSLH